jgi:hypothetical protein
MLMVRSAQSLDMRAFKYAVPTSPNIALAAICAMVSFK